MNKTSYRYALLALHGNGGGGFRYELTKPHFPKDVLFLTPTLPGFAAIPKEPNFTTLRDYAQYVVKLLEQMPRPRVLLGHGIGGSIAMELVQKHADRIDGLILHAPVGTKLDQRLFPQLMRPRWMRKLAQNMIADPLFRPIWKRMFFSKPVPNDYLHRFFAEYRTCQVFGDMFDLITTDWFVHLKPQPVKTILLWGEKERILKHTQVNDYQKLFPKATVHLEQDWDHFPMIEQPRAYAQIIQELAEVLIRS
jgi:pimeloyl-ACP methyl ester carboxylesterase